MWKKLAHWIIKSIVSKPSKKVCMIFSYVCVRKIIYCKPQSEHIESRPSNEMFLFKNDEGQSGPFKFKHQALSHTLCHFTSHILSHILSYHTHIFHKMFCLNMLIGWMLLLLHIVHDDQKHILKFFFQLVTRWDQFWETLQLNLNQSFDKG